MIGEDHLVELETLRAVRNGVLDTSHVFGRCKAGSAPVYVIVNSVPKSGTYFLLEIVKALGFADIGFHLYRDRLRKVHDDGSTDHERHIPAVLSTAALKPGQACPAHLRYSFVLENALLTRPDHRMLFIIRDPRDLVISRVDFVHESKGYLSTAWNSILRSMRQEKLPTDEDRIASQIESHLARRLDEFMPWIDSPACHTVRFEALYEEMTGSAATPVIDGLLAYLDISGDKAALSAVLGIGRTASPRQKKIGIWHDRMTPEHIARIKQPNFQKLVVEFGYEPTD